VSAAEHRASFVSHQSRIGRSEARYTCLALDHELCMRIILGKERNAQLCTPYGCPARIQGDGYMSFSCFHFREKRHSFSLQKNGTFMSDNTLTHIFEDQSIDNEMFVGWNLSFYNIVFVFVLRHPLR
jgi:hypothetical protein